MTRLLLLTALLALCACRVESTSPTAAPASPAGPTETGVQTIALGPHTVQCGCTIESIGGCGNYIQIDGAWQRIRNGDELGLGTMAWCGQGPVQAQAAGTLDADGFTGTTLTTD